MARHQIHLVLNHIREYGHQDSVGSVNSMINANNGGIEYQFKVRIQVAVCQIIARC